MRLIKATMFTRVSLLSMVARCSCRGRVSDGVRCASAMGRAKRVRPERHLRERGLRATCQSDSEIRIGTPAAASASKRKQRWKDERPRGRADSCCFRDPECEA